MEDFENVIRWNCCWDGYMEIFEPGDYVSTDDYFKLLKEYKRVLGNQGG
jgi:hypothetical protein